MVRFKLFFGANNNMADDKANTWLNQHPNIKIIEMKYQQARYGDHSICIMYEEKTNHNRDSLSYKDTYEPLARVTCCICGRSNMDNPSLKFRIAPFGLAAPSGWVCEDCDKKGG